MKHEPQKHELTRNNRAVRALETKQLRWRNSDHLVAVMQSLCFLCLTIFISNILLKPVLHCFICILLTTMKQETFFFCFFLSVYFGLLHITLPPTAHCHVTCKYDGTHLLYKQWLFICEFSFICWTGLLFYFRSLLVIKASKAESVMSR